VQKSPALLRVTAAWLLALVVAIVGSVVAVRAVKSTVSGPEQPVRSYIAALQAGDGARALGVLRAQVPPGSPALLDGTPLRDSMSRVQDLAFETTESNDDHASVTVHYTVDGGRHDSTFRLERAGTDWLFFPRWQMVRGTLPTLQATVVNSARATVNGVAVNMPGGANAFPVFYPGSYVGSLPGEQFAADPSAVVVSGPSGTPAMSLATKATPQLVESIETKVRGYLDECARTATQQQRLQPDCPFALATNSRIQDGTIQWSVETYPKVSVEPFEGHWVVAPLTGTARLKATQINLFTGARQPLDEELGYEFSARLDVTDTAITVTPQFK
jgi:hypothetical protein